VWIDDWLAEKKTEKVKRGRLVTLRSPETIALLERWAGYLKKRFGRLYRPDITRPNGRGSWLSVCRLPSDALVAQELQSKIWKAVDAWVTVGGATICRMIG
jgi:hypothetical protein